MPRMFQLEDIQEADENMEGFCTSCGEVRSNTECDATNYPCECCGENKVFGAMELLVMGRVE